MAIIFPYIRNRLEIIMYTDSVFCEEGTEFFCMTVFPKTDKITRCSILSTIKLRKTICISHILRRNCHLKHVLERKTEGKGRRRRRHTELLDGLKERRRCLNFKDKALDGNVWRTYLDRGYGQVATRLRMNE